MSIAKDARATAIMNKVKGNDPYVFSHRFKGYNEIYAKHFEEIQATRTTLAIQALPTPIAVEMKVIAKAP